MGASLRKLVGALGRLLAGFLVAVLLVFWTPENLPGQDTDAYDRAPAPELPRSTLRQIVTGSNDTLRRIPGPWFQAAIEAHPESLITARYHAVARLSGVAALERKALESERFQHTMGLYRREELRSAAVRTLEAIRSSIPSDTTRAGFDRIFRPRGNWIVDPLTVVEIPGVEPFPAERFAEWTAERILERLQRRWPLIALGELEKRAGLVKNGVEDQHSTGCALVTTLAAALNDPPRTMRLLWSHAERPADIARLPELRRAWRKYGGGRDRMLPVPPRRILIPEVTFTVEDGYPDVVASRIVVPAIRRPAR